MTQADSTQVLGMSLDRPTGADQVAGTINVTTPLPPGWGSFCSKPDEESIPRWYATSPYNVAALRDKYGKAAWPLQATVEAETWPRLHAVVAEQESYYKALMGDGEQ